MGGLIRGSGSNKTWMCVPESAATPSPALPHQGAGLTARKWRGKKNCLVFGQSVVPLADSELAPLTPTLSPPVGGEGEMKRGRAA